LKRSAIVRRSADGPGWDDHRLEERHRHEQHLGRRLGDDVREHPVAGHERHLAERAPGLEAAERQPRAPATDHGRRGDAREDDAEVRRGRAVVDDRLVGLERRDRRALDELAQTFVGKVREQPDVGLQEGDDLEVRFHRTCSFRGSLVTRPLALHGQARYAQCPRGPSRGLARSHEPRWRYSLRRGESRRAVAAVRAS
jgi:hypothetical protein